MQKKFLKSRENVSANSHGAQALLDFLATPCEEVDNPLKWWDSWQEWYGSELNLSIWQWTTCRFQVSRVHSPVYVETKTYHLTSYISGC